MIRRLGLGGALVVCLAGCQAKSPTPLASPAPVALPVISVGRANLTATITLSGTVNPLPDHSVKISPAVAGRLAAVLPQEGQWVSQGEVVARLDSQVAQTQVDQSSASLEVAQAGVSQARTALLLAANNLARQRQLYGEKIAPRKDLVAALSQYQSAQAQLRAAQAQAQQAEAVQDQSQTQASFTRVTSPLTGVVAHRFLNQGDITDPNTPILQVVNLQNVLVSAHLPADQQAHLHPGQSVNITTPAYPGRIFPGMVTAISPVVDPASNTVSVAIRVPNPGELLKENQAVSVVAVTAVHDQALTIPQTALVPDPAHPGQQLVYVYAHQRIKRVPIQTGIKSHGQVEVTAGLQAGELIVAQGAYGFPDGTMIVAQKG